MTIPSTPSTLAYVRSNVRDLLNEFDTADALASYYTLYHNDKRTTIYMHRNNQGEIDGFLTSCQTGIDLFRPVVTLRVRGTDPLEPLLSEGLPAGRPHLMIIPAYLLERVESLLTLTDIQRNRIYRLDLETYRPQINALVVTKQDPSGNPRAEIRRNDSIVAAAGVNWRSPLYAEIYVNVLSDNQGRGMGWAVVNALVAELLKMEVTPLYNAAENNIASRELAERVGFIDTGAREIMAQAMR